ncbi:uncharacterized protein [Salvelinus alpinus]|uniref:uncharacterized protein isoform X2 n=1 Tax=Salvelinus alpinus TaxID=8036 RepID=UPI0039FCFA7B
MEHTLLCLLLLLSTHIYSGHSEEDDGQAKAVLTIYPTSSQIFSGESVTLRCNIQRGEVTDWEYTWSKDDVNFFSRKNEYEIREIKISDSAEYWCLGKHIVNGTYSKWSDAVRLTVTDQPQAVLSVSPQWLNPGDSVTLSCGVKESSTGWRFFWYRTVPYTAGLLSLSDSSYSVEPLSGDGTTEDTYTLIPAGPSHTGGYVCRAGRGDPVYDTLYSEPQFFWSGDPQPSVSLKIRPNRTQHFTSKSLSLSCEEKRNSTGWRLKRYREKAVESECVSNWGSRAGSTCTISSTFFYFIFILFLFIFFYFFFYRYFTRYQETNPIPKVDFYKDGVLIRNETTGEMTIPAVSKSDEGSYKCKFNEGESPESWVTVRGVTPGPSTLVLVGVVVGLVVAGVLLAILLVLLCRYKNAKGSCCNRTFSVGQDVSWVGILCCVSS